MDRKFEDGKDSAVGNTLNDIFFGGGGKNKSSGTTATPNTTSASTTNIPTTQSQRDCNKCCYCFDVSHHRYSRKIDFLCARNTNVSVRRVMDIKN